MNSKFKIAAIAAVLAAGLWAAPQLQAHDTTAPEGATAQPGQMMGDHMMGGHMMGHGMQPGQMGMMGQMDRMVKTCNDMMQTTMLDHHQSETPEPGTGDGDDG